MPGQEPVPLSLGLKCSKASSGWAVTREMTAKNGDRVITETDLMGADPVTAQGHWYAFGGRKSLEFRSVTSADGQEVARFSGTVTKR